MAPARTRTKRRRWPWIAGALILALVLTGALLPRTEMARSLVRDFVSGAVTDALNGTLSIGSIQGNLWGSITLRDVTLSGRRDTLARLGALHLEYDLLPLLRKEIRLRQITIDSLHLTLRQSEQETWNIAELIPPGDSTAGDTSPFAWTITVLSVQIRGLSAVVDPAGETPGIPRTLERLDLEGSLAYSAEHWQLAITRSSLATADPVLHLRRLVLAAEGDNEHARIDSFSVATEQITLRASATARTQPALTFTASLLTSTPSFEELRPLFPGLPLRMLPPLTLTAEYADDTLDVEARLGTVRLRGSIAAPSRAPVATVYAEFSDIDPGQWLLAQLPPATLTGSLSTSAPLRDPLRGRTTFSLALMPSTVAGQTIDRASITGSIEDGSLRTAVKIAGPGAGLEGHLSIRDLSGHQDLSASVEFAEVDPSRLADLPQLPGSLNGSVTLTGKPLDIERFQGEATLALRRSAIASLPVDSLLLSCSLRAPRVTIDTLLFSSPGLTLEGFGHARHEGSVDLQFRSHLVDAAPLAALAGIDSLSGGGDLRGTLHRTGDSLALAARWELSGVRGFGAHVDSLSGSAVFTAGPSGPAVDADIVAREPGAGSLRADSITASGTYRQGVISIQSSLAIRRDVHIDLTTLLMRDSLLHLMIPRFRASLQEEEWTTGPDTLTATIGKGRLALAHATFSAGTRSITASGTLSTEGENDFTVSIDRLSLSSLHAFLDSAPPLRGEVSLAAHLKGPLPEPLASCSLTVANAELGEQKLGVVHALAEYRGDSTLTWRVSMAGPRGNQLAADGSLPLEHTPLWDSVAVSRHRPLQARLLLDDYQLGRLAAAAPELDRLSGVVTSDLSLGGTVESPVFAGSLRMENAAIFSTALGIAYDSIDIELAGEDTLLLLRSASVRSNRGVLRASGVLASMSDLAGLALRPRRLDLEMRDFLATASDNLELRLSGPLSLQADQDTLRVSGDLTVPRARVWLPAFFRHRGAGSDQRTPLLVAALEEQDTLTVRDTLATSPRVPSVLDRVAGRIHVRIPSNTWLQSQELNVEISGDLEITIAGSAMLVGGFAKVERGTFTILGKRFVVREGRADFSGGTELIPQVSMEVAYTFRRPDGIQQSLDLLISGKATSPTLSFRLSGEPVSEQDAVSYVLFGRSLDELSQSQKSSVSQSTGDLAAGLAASFLTAQLSSTVGEAFGLDVLELDVQDAGRQSSFTAGKYLSDRLYVRYTRRINDPSTNETNTDEVALEYRLLPFLYIQMIQGTSKATGYDLLFRFD